MQHFHDNFTNKNGDAIAGVGLRVSQSGVDAVLYSDNGSTRIGNPVYSDALGEVSFYAANGTYDVSLVGASSTTTKDSPITLFDPADALSDPDNAGDATPAYTGAERFAVKQGGAWRRISLTNLAAWLINTVTTWVQVGGAVARTLLSKLREIEISVTDFGALCNSDGTTGNGADDTVAVQAAINAGNVSGRNFRLKIPAAVPGVCRVTAPLTSERAFALVGDGVSPYIGSPGTRGPGSWLYFDHTGIGLSISNAGSAISGMFLDKFGTLRNQPAPGPGWAPTANDFDISIDNTDLTIGDLLLLNPTKGVKLRNGNYGRLTIGRLRGQAMQVMLDLDQCADNPQVGIIKSWPFWQDDANVHAYTKANLDVLYFQRVDSPQIVNLFTIAARSGLRIGQSADGTTTKLMAVNVDCDLGKHGLWIDNTVTGMAYASKIANFQSHADATGSIGIYVQGSNCKLMLENTGANICDMNGIRVEGTGNIIQIGKTEILNYNGAAAGHSAIYGDAGNTIYVTAPPYATGGGAGPVYGGAATYYLAPQLGGDGSLSLTTAGATGSLNITDAGANGANIYLLGNGATTPGKYVRVANGRLEVLSDNYGATLLQISDGGNFGIFQPYSTTTYMILPASIAGISSLRVPHGVAPAAPVNGDMWTTTAGLFARINGATNTLAVVSGDLGTPDAVVLTNATGTAASLTAGHVTTNADLTGAITSVGNATAIASQTGTGTKFVVDTSPVLVTPNIGAATGTSAALNSGAASAAATLTSSGSAVTLLVQDTGGNGANILIAGDGVTTPNKTVRVAAGAFQLLNNAYSVVIMSVTDAGAVSIPGGYSGLTGTAPPANGAATAFFVKASSTADLGVYFGTGTPTFNAAKGSLYVNTGATTTTTRLYINTSGTNTWATFTASA